MPGSNFTERMSSFPDSISFHCFSTSLTMCHVSITSLSSSTQANDWQLVLFIDLHFCELSAFFTQRRGGGVNRIFRFCYLFHLSYPVLGLEIELPLEMSLLSLSNFCMLHNQEALLEFPANCQRTQNYHTSLYSPLKSSTSSSVGVSYLLFAASIGWIHLT